MSIDNTANNILGAYFDTRETLHVYYQVIHQTLTNYGIPAKFLTDYSSILSIKENVSSNKKDTLFQFSYACLQLGIELECTSISQVKERIERLYQTLQSYLVIELRLVGISTIEEANQFLNSSIKEFNKSFSCLIHRIKHIFEKQLSNTRINQILSVLSYRKLESGHCISYQNKYYISIMKNTQKA